MPYDMTLPSAPADKLFAVRDGVQLLLEVRHRLAIMSVRVADWFHFAKASDGRRS